MKLDTIALVLGLLGTVGSIVTFLVYYPTERRRRKAEARKLEIEGDVLSVEYFTKIIDEMKSDYEEMKKKIEKLKKEIDDLKNKLTNKEWLISIFELAGKECHDCEGNTEEHPCPAITKFNELKQ